MRGATPGATAKRNATERDSCVYLRTARSKGRRLGSERHRSGTRRTATRACTCVQRDRKGAVWDRKGAWRDRKGAFSGSERPFSRKGAWRDQQGAWRDRKGAASGSKRRRFGIERAPLRDRKGAASGSKRRRFGIETAPSRRRPPSRATVPRRPRAPGFSRAGLARRRTGPATYCERSAQYSADTASQRTPLRSSRRRPVPLRAPSCAQPSP